MTAVATPEQDAKTAVTTDLVGRSTRHPVVAGLASGLLLWTSFPPAEWNWLAWICACAVILACDPTRRSPPSVPGSLGRRLSFLVVRRFLGATV